jgi:type II secretory pathway pseudopilin PulG
MKMKGFTPLEASQKNRHYHFSETKSASPYRKGTTLRSDELLRGFTLIETLVMIFVLILTLGATAGFAVVAYRTYGFTWQQSTAIDEARRGIETMVKEVRAARTGEDGSYPIEKAEDKELIFYSDIDGDGKTERVRYFLGTVNSGSQTKECQTSVKGGTCSADFSAFLKGTLISAQVKASLDGDFGASQEYAEIFADVTKLGDICRGSSSGCSDCPGAWQGQTVFDVTNQASDNSISFLADATTPVDPICSHAMKAKFEFSWTENLAGFAHEFKKGVVQPLTGPDGRVTYPSDQEEFIFLTSYVRNEPPIFEYFDKNGNKITDYPARLVDTVLLKVYLVVNVDPNRPPGDFGLESYVQLRNLKKE